jgi:hypothetical protein
MWKGNRIDVEVLGVLGWLIIPMKEITEKDLGDKPLLSFYFLLILKFNQKSFFN